MIHSIGWAAIALALLLPPLAFGASGAGRGRLRRSGAVDLLAHWAALAALIAGLYLLAGSAERWIVIGALLAGAVWIGVFWIARARSSGEIAKDGVAPGAGDAAGETGEGPDGLTREAEGLLRRLMEMREMRVESILTPRERIVAADCSEGVAGALAKVHSSGRMRIPMTDGSLDRVMGVVHAKDLTPLLRQPGKVPALKGLMRRPLFISRDSNASDLLELFRSARAHLAIVVDPFGRTVGLVTRRDLFRHLTGSGENPG